MITYYGNQKIHQEFSVCQVEDYSFVNLDSEYSFIGKTDEEKSLVCITSEVPPNVIQCDDGWKALRIQGVLNLQNNRVTASNLSGKRVERQIGIERALSCE